MAARRETIAQMARQGHREESIAEAVRVTVDNVRATMKAAGIPTIAQKIGRTAALNADRIMDGIVTGAEPSDVALRALDWAALDRARFPEWRERLTVAIRELTQLRNRLGPEG